MPLTIDELPPLVVVVVTAIEPLAVLDPTTLPSAVKRPPMFVAKPLVSMPIKTLDVPASGTDDTAILAILFPLIMETGVAAVVVVNIP